TESPTDTAVQNSSMHSEARPPTGNAAISRHWQSPLHIPAHPHPRWCHQTAYYRPHYTLVQDRSSSKALSHDQYADSHLAQVEDVSLPVGYGRLPGHL